LSGDKSGDLGGQGVGPPRPTNFRAAALPQTSSRPNDNEVVPHPAGSVNGVSGYVVPVAVRSAEKGPYTLPLEVNKTRSHLASQAQTPDWPNDSLSLSLPPHIYTFCPFTISPPILISKGYRGEAAGA